MVLTVKAKTLWSLARRCLPEMMYAFDAFLMVLRAIHEEQLAPGFEASALERIYKDIAPADFSRDLLQHSAEQSRVMRMEGVKWCDWGQPKRVVETLADLDRQPLFEPEQFALTAADARNMQ